MSSKHSAVGGPKTLKIHSWILFEDSVYEVIGFDKDNPALIFLENAKSREIQTILVDQLFLVQNEHPVIVASSYDELLNRITKPEKSLVPDGGADVNVPNHLLLRAKTVIETFQSADGIIKTHLQDAKLKNQNLGKTAAIRAACETLNISVSHYYKCKSRVQNFAADPIRIAMSFHRKTFQQIRVARSILHFIDTMLVRYYFRSDFMLSPSKIYVLMENFLLEKGNYWINVEACDGDIPEDLTEELLNPRIPIKVLLDNPEKCHRLIKVTLPKKRWLYGYLRWYGRIADPDGIWFRQRYGESAYEQEFLLFDVFLKKAAAPLQYVFLDHTMLPFFVLDENDPDKLLVLWLTMLIDCYSRSILGYALSTRCGATESILSAIKMAIYPKNKLLESHGIQLPWSAYGMFKSLSLDNAWAHYSTSLVTLSKDISLQGLYPSFEIRWRPPYKGRFGAIIERYFKSLKKDIRQLGIQTFSKNNPKSTANAAKQASLLVTDVDHIVLDLITKYQNTPHSELEKMTPEEKLREGMQMERPLVPALTTELERLFWILYPETRIITQHGLSIHGYHYTSKKMSVAPRVDQSGRPIQYSIYTNPASIGQIALFCNGKYTCDAYAKNLQLPDGELQIVSMAEFFSAKKISSITGQSARNLFWIDTYDENSQLIAQREKEQKERIKRKKGKNETNNGLPDRNEILTDDQKDNLLINFTGG